METDYGKWHIEYTPEDGARISALRFDGYDLLTEQVPGFRPPESFAGEFETRPVFGYDDCFPSVDACISPDTGISIRDHGELCWLPWKVSRAHDGLIFSVDCEAPSVSFVRTLAFDENSILWKFRVRNRSEKKVSFLHVMHALFPLQSIAGFQLPGCASIFDEIMLQDSGLIDPSELTRFPDGIPVGGYAMLLMRDISEGEFVLVFDSGKKLTVRFDKTMFPTLGIWWNNSGYPGSGVLRSECAFEPIPGNYSDLAKSYLDGRCLETGPSGECCWEISWTIS